MTPTGDGFGTCRLESVDSVVGGRIVATAAALALRLTSLVSTLSSVNTNNKRELPDIGPNGGLGAQGRQHLRFDVGHGPSL